MVMQAGRWASLAGAALCALLVASVAAGRPTFDPCCNVKLSDSRLGGLEATWNLQTVLAVLKSVRLQPPDG